MCFMSGHSSSPLNHQCTSSFEPHGTASSCLSSCNHDSLTTECRSPFASYNHSTSPHHGGFSCDGLLLSPETKEALHSCPQSGLSFLCSFPSCRCGSSGSCRPPSFSQSSSPAGENYSSSPSYDCLPTHSYGPLSGRMGITSPCSGHLSGFKYSGSVGGGPSCISSLSFGGSCSGLCSTAGFQSSHLGMPTRVTPLTSFSSRLCSHKRIVIGLSIRITFIFRARPSLTF